MFLSNLPTMVRKSTMGCYVNIIFTMMLVIKSKQYNRENCCRSSHFQLLAENSRADAPSISSEFTQVISMCAQLCLAQILCTSFNYHNVAKICQLLAYNHFDDKAEILIQSPGWSFYQKELIQVWFVYYFPPVIQPNQIYIQRQPSECNTEYL